MVKFDLLKNRLKNTLLFLTVLALFTCQSKRQYTSKPSKSLDNPDTDLLEANAVAYHINDSVSVAYLEVKNENLLYKRPDTTKAFYAELSVSYKLLSEQYSRKILDSGTYFLTDRAEYEYVKIKPLYSQFRLKAYRGNTYFLEVEIFDNNRRVKYSHGITIYKQIGREHV